MWYTWEKCPYAVLGFVQKGRKEIRGKVTYFDLENKKKNEEESGEDAGDGDEG